MSTIKLIDVSVDGLDDKEQYNFIFNNRGGNWPVKIMPRSGVFYPPQLNSYAYFCPSAASCSPSDPSVFYNIPTTNLKQTTLSVDNTTLYTVLDLVITNSNNNNVVYSRSCLVECDTCLPNIDISAPDVTLNASTKNANNIPITISGLIPNQEYTYKFEGIDGNWPISILPSSGTIQSTKETYILSSLASFCNSSDNCQKSQSDILKYQQSNQCYAGDELYGKIKLTITPIDISALQTKTQTSFSIVCDNCLTKPTVSLPNSVTLTSSTTSKTTVSATLSNLKAGEKYSYRFFTSDANWPIVLYPNSGVIVPTSDNQTISVRLSFCASTGLCPQNTIGVEPYSINTLLSYGVARLEKICKLKMELTQDCNNSKVSSSESTIICSNCLDKYSVGFTNAPLLSLSYPCCTGTRDLTATIVGSPAQAYRYEFIPTISDGKISTLPISGIAVTDINGNITFGTRLTSDLSDSNTRALRVITTNLTSGETATDTLTVQCGGTTSC
jgi:hypothetical protein